MYFTVHSSAFSHELTICRGKNSINNRLNSIKTLVVSFAALRSLVLVQRQRHEHTPLLRPHSHMHTHSQSLCFERPNFESSEHMSTTMCIAHFTYNSQTQRVLYMAAFSRSTGGKFCCVSFLSSFFSHNNHQIEFLLRCDSQIHFRTTILLNWKRGSQLPLRFIIIIRYSMHALPVRQLSCFVFRFVGERNFTIHTTSVVEARSVALLQFFLHTHTHRAGTTSTIARVFIHSNVRKWRNGRKTETNLNWIKKKYVKTGSSQLTAHT